MAACDMNPGANSLNQAALYIAMIPVNYVS
jgi:hypothetical protein